MSEPHRLEDLGRIRERMETLLDNDLWDLCESKQDLSPFARQYENHIEDLHVVLRRVKQDIESIFKIIIHCEDE